MLIVEESGNSLEVYIKQISTPFVIAELKLQILSASRVTLFILLRSTALLNDFLGTDTSERE